MSSKQVALNRLSSFLVTFSMHYYPVYTLNLLSNHPARLLSFTKISTLPDYWVHSITARLLMFLKNTTLLFIRQVREF